MKRILTSLICALTMLATQAQAVMPANLTIVGETTFVMEQEPRADWGSTIYDIPVPGIAELLGVEKNELQANFTSMFYAQTWDFAVDNWGELVNDGNVDVPAGFYYKTDIVMNEEGNEQTVCINTYDWSACIFFFHKGLYDPEYDIVQIGCGQNPAATARVGKHSLDNYIVNGDKAYVIHVNVNIVTPEQENLDALTSIGGEDWVVDMRDPRNSWFELDSLVLDWDVLLENFSSAIGKEITLDDIALMAINEYDGVSYMYTADNDEESQGFWFDAYTGKTRIYDWGTPSYFINLSRTDGVLYVGNMPNVFGGGEEMKTKLYLVADGTHYYEINFTMTIAAPEFTLETCQIQEMQMVVQLVPSSEAWDVRHLDVTYIEDMLGASDLKFYGVTADSLITTNYSVSEAAQGGGGFWMSPLTEDGWAHAAGYTGSGAFAIWYTGAGEMWFFNVPGLSQPGDKAKATFYMANLWDGLALKINMTVRYVQEIKEVEPLGVEDIAIPGRDEAGQLFSETEIDLSACLSAIAAAATGVGEDEIYENISLAVINQDGDLTSDGQNSEGLFTFNADGELVDEDAENAAFRIGMADNLIYGFIINDENLDNEYKATVYVVYTLETEETYLDENEEEQTRVVEEQFIYAYNVTVGNKAFTAIAAVPATAAASKTFDLMGREVSQPTKGLYIKAGKKVVVK